MLKLIPLRSPETPWLELISCKTTAKTSVLRVRPSRSLKVVVVISNCFQAVTLNSEMCLCDLLAANRTGAVQNGPHDPSDLKVASGDAPSSPNQHLMNMERQTDAPARPVCLSGWLALEQSTAVSIATLILVAVEYFMLPTALLSSLKVNCISLSVLL